MFKLFHLSRAQQWFQPSKSSVLRALAILTLGLLAAHGARAQKVTTEFDRTADFSKYKTFAIRDGRLNSGNPALNSPLVKKQIEADIQNDLTAKGLTMVSSGPADLNIRYTFGAVRKSEVEAYPAGWYGMGRATCESRTPKARSSSTCATRQRAPLCGAPSPQKKKATRPRSRVSSTPWLKSRSISIRRRSSGLRSCYWTIPQ